MQKESRRADEMEMDINFRSMRVAYVFSLFALIGYCIYRYASLHELPFIPFIVVCGQLVLFYSTKLYLGQKATWGVEDEE